MCTPQLANFFRSMKDDNRMTATHISLYTALFARWESSNFQSPVAFTRRELMEAAKINGLATYHRCMKDLNDFGYVQYRPSFNPAIGSRVFFLAV
jgi:hypothetical protein